MNVTCLLAPNPGVMTGPGTNTWVVENRGLAIVIDPGPAIDDHIAAVVAHAGSYDPVAVLVTHGHPDHAPAANAVARRLGVPALGPAPAPGFRPDRLLADADEVAFDGSPVTVVATPGHTADSTSYLIGDALFTGDHIMGGSTVMVEDMGSYMASLVRVAQLGPRVIHPGHGPTIDDPSRLVQEYIAHRTEREAQIVASIRGGAATIGAVVEDVYAAVDRSLHPAASVSVEAHVRKLADDGVVTLDGSGWSASVVPV